jgi:hypothetical protein
VTQLRQSRLIQSTSSGLMEQLTQLKRVVEVGRQLMNPFGAAFEAPNPLTLEPPEATILVPIMR